MSILQITPKELMYHRKNFYETQRVHGIPCLIKSIGTDKSTTHDFYGDVKDETTYTTQVSTFITYDEAPTIKTLKSLGMYIDKDNPPILGYIPVYYESILNDPNTPPVVEVIDIDPLSFEVEDGDLVLYNSEVIPGTEFIINEDQELEIHTGVIPESENPPPAPNPVPATFIPRVDDLIEIQVNSVDANNCVRKFLIKDFEGKGFPNVIYYVCKIVPHREDIVND